MAAVDEVPEANLARHLQPFRNLARIESDQRPAELP